MTWPPLLCSISDWVHVDEYFTHDCVILLGSCTHIDVTVWIMTAAQASAGLQGTAAAGRSCF
jgi:hypothetical protein